MLQFSLQYCPVAKDRPRFHRIGNYVATHSSRKTKIAEQEINLLASKYRLAKPLPGPVYIKLVFHLPRPKSKKHKKYHDIRPDLDNFIKLVLDAFNRGSLFWNDDAQIARIYAEKRYADDIPKIDVEIHPL